MARDTQRENQLRKARKKAFEGAIKEHYIAYQECRLKSNKRAKNPDELLELALEDGDVYDFLFGDYGYPVHGTFDRKIKTDWGVPLNFPYLDYEEMASALVGKQKRDACFRASAEVNRAVLAAIDVDYVKSRHHLESDAEMIARTLVNMADALCLVFFAARSRDFEREAGLVFFSETLAALFQEAWFNKSLLDLIGCYSFLFTFTYLHPGSDKYCFEKTRSLPDGFRDVLGAGGCSGLYFDAMLRIRGC